MFRARVSSTRPFHNLIAAPLLAVACLVCAAAPARAFDSNTPESVIFVEEGEVGFITFGTAEPRQVGPGQHNKMPFLERAAIIDTTAVGQTGAVADVKGLDGHICSVGVNIEFQIGDPRKTFDWYRERGFEIGYLDNTEPSRVYGAALSKFLSGLTPQAAMCGAIETWVRQDYGSLVGAINDDGTTITSAELDSACASDLRYRLTDTQAPCRSSPPLSRSFSSSARDTRRHRSSHQTQR